MESGEDAIVAPWSREQGEVVFVIIRVETAPGALKAPLFILVLHRPHLCVCVCVMCVYALCALCACVVSV